nr:glycerol-3-phosphate dehydrogenase/oxidase [Paeniglutamicibacter quisquiliarum]
MVLPSVDVLVIGGGVNGLAVGREAAFSGWSVAVAEAEDFGAGTSAASSRLIHGGIRYLENFEVRLVRESLCERERLLQNAPHLVKPFPLLIPFFSHNSRSARILRLGMFLYDVLSFDKSTGRHRSLSAAEVIKDSPGIETRGLSGAVLYYDAQAAHAERLCIEQALDIANQGGRVDNHHRVVGLARDGKELRVQIVNTLTGRKFLQPARTVVNAAGPWVDKVLSHSSETSNQLIGGTKGSHLTVKRFPGAPSTGVHYEATSDGRAILVLPLPDGNYLIGSTDLFFEGDPSEAIMSDDEVSYLLQEVNALIPQARLAPEDIVHSVAGVRPLPYAPKAKSAAQVSRDHQVIAHPTLPGLFSISGGKLTTHRALGELTMRVLKRHVHGLGRCPGESRSRTRRMKLPGARCADWNGYQAEFLKRSILPEPTARRLLDLYGIRAESVEALARSDPALAAPISGTAHAIGAEVAIAVREEFAVTLTDIVARRLLLAWSDDAGLQSLEAVAELAATELKWDRQQTTTEIEAYREWILQRRPRFAKDLFPA